MLPFAFFLLLLLRFFFLRFLRFFGFRTFVVFVRLSLCRGRVLLDKLKVFEKTVKYDKSRMALIFEKFFDGRATEWSELVRFASELPEIKKNIMIVLFFSYNITSINEYIREVLRSRILDVS